MRHLAIILFAVALSGCVGVEADKGTLNARVVQTPNAIAAEGRPRNPPLFPMRFRYASNGEDCAQCVWIAAEGNITENSVQDFLALQSTSPESFTDRQRVGLIALHSSGGRLSSALNLGLLFRELGYSVVVARTVLEVQDPRVSTPPPARQEAGICASACTFAFLGGVSRRVNRGSLLGAHQFGLTDGIGLAQTPSLATITTQESIAEVFEYLAALGFELDLLRPVLQTSPDSMHWFSADELEEFGIDTFTPRRSQWEARLDQNRNLILEIEQRQRTSNLQVRTSLSCEAAPPELFTITMSASLANGARGVDFINERSLGPIEIRPVLQEAEDAILDAQELASASQNYSAPHVPITMQAIRLGDDNETIFIGTARRDLFADVLSGANDFSVDFGASRSGVGEPTVYGPDIYEFPIGELVYWLPILAQSCSR